MGGAWLSTTPSISHVFALNIMSHIPDSSHHPKKKFKKKMCIIQDWCSLSLKSAQASLYIVRDGRKSWGLLWESFQLSVWLIFPAGSLCHTEKVKAWEKTYKELLKKNIWLRHFTGLLQLPLSQLMTLDNKCISNKYPEGSLEFLCVGVDMCEYVYMCVKVVMYI